MCLRPLPEHCLRLSALTVQPDSAVIRLSASLPRMIYRMIKDPQAIRDFARTLLRSPASFPTISPDR